MMMFAEDTFFYLNPHSSW